MNLDGKLIAQVKLGRIPSQTRKNRKYVKKCAAAMYDCTLIIATAKPMPYIALNDLNDEVTSFQCLDEYVREGTQYTDFRCAFCEVGYVAKSIYGTRTAGTAPHFALKKGLRHIGDCDGEPIVEGASRSIDKPVRLVTKREYDVPEKLVAKPVSRIKIPIPPGGGRDVPNTEKIRQRRTKAGRDYGTARYTSSLLLSFIEAKRFLLSECYRKVNVEKISDETQKKLLLKTTTASYPLQLFDQKLNYDTAFWGGNNTRSGGPRIFHAHRGAAVVTATGFTISSKPAGTLIKQAGEDIKTKKLTAVVRFELGNSVAPLPRAHRKLLEQLCEAEKTGVLLAWHAYGTMETKDDQNLISLSSLDHLHIGA